MWVPVNVKAQSAEIIGDRGIGLPPLNRFLAIRLIEQTKVSIMLGGFRHLPLADLTKLEEILVRLFHALSPETIFQRFGRLLKTMPPDLLSRHTQIDYDREMALVVFPKGSDEIIAVGRVTERPGQSEADLGMTVADAWQCHGLATC